MKVFYLVVAIVSLAVSLVLTVPADYVYGWASPRSMVRAYQITGSLWRGEASAIRIRQLNLHQVRWRFTPASLLRARAGYILSADTDHGHLQGEVSIGPSGNPRFDDVEITAPLADLTPAVALPKLPIAGQLSARLTRIQLSHGQLTDAAGTLRLGETRWILGDPPIPLGSFTARLTTVPGPTLKATLGNDSGPLELRGDASLNPAGQWRLNARLRPRANASETIKRLLELTGRPDAQGAYSIRAQGHLQ